MSHYVTIALGGNLGNTEEYFQKAFSLLKQKLLIIKLAHVITTKPVDCVPGTPDFKNTVFTAIFDGTPIELLAFCQSIERTLGRPKEHSSHESRTIDIDILLFDDQQISLPNLTIPHPRMFQRLFVLQPLLELIPGYAILPGQSRSLQELVDDLVQNQEKSPNAKENSRLFAPPYPEFFSMANEKLKSEWEAIVLYGNLKRYEAKKVPEPSIEFAESKTKHGWYSPPPQNTITISYELLMEHPWYSVLDVFYHEVAHQLVQFLCPEATDETSHGKAFREMCRRIGANPSAGDSYQTLDSWLSQEQNDTGDPIIERVRKLLVMAEKGDEHEAEVALSKAVEIMAKYGISEEHLNQKEQYVTVALGEPKYNIQLDERAMAQFLNEMFSVTTIMGNVPAITTDRRGNKAATECRQLFMCGTARNVKIAQYVRDSVLSHIDLEWRKFCRKNCVDFTLVRRKRDFAYGVISALLKKMRCNLGKETQALIVAENHELNSYYTTRFPHTHTVTRSGVNIDPNAYAAGKKIGSDLTIKPGIEKPEGPKLLS